MVATRLTLILGVICLLVIPAFGEDLSPIDVVQLFGETYGTAEMDKAADLTTENERWKDQSSLGSWHLERAAIH